MNQDVLSLIIETDALAKTIAIGFNPVRVDIVRLDNGYTAICAEEAVKAAVLKGSSAAAVDNFITFNGDNSITLGVQADFNADGKKILLSAFRG